MLGIGSTEFVIILFFGFLIFGPEKLPQMGRTIGRAIRQFREASEAMSKTIKTEVTDPFQEAMAPYQETIQETVAPLQEDLQAIDKTLRETEDSIKEPLKELANPMGTESYNKYSGGKKMGRTAKRTGHSVREGHGPSLFGTSSKSKKDETVSFGSTRTAEDNDYRQEGTDVLAGPNKKAGSGSGAGDKAGSSSKATASAKKPAQAEGTPKAAEKPAAASAPAEEPAASAAPAASASAEADEPKPAAKKQTAKQAAPATSGNDPFASAVHGSPEPEKPAASAEPAPTGTDSASLAAALYGLDDDAKGGE